MKKDRELQLLVCSANLGNEQPDDDSLADLIPEDGRCTQVLKTPQTYPIRTIQEESKSNGEDGDGESDGDKEKQSSFDDYESTDQFDIIVIGLQESTFDIPEDSSAVGGNILVSIPVVQPIVQRGLKGIKKARKAVTKGANLASGSCDHTKKQGKRPFTIKLDEWNGGTVVLHKMLEARLPSYDHIVSYQRGEMRLEVFSSQEIDVKVLRVTAQNTGRGGLANKGGIVTELLVNGSTRLSFLTAHLEAHEGASKYATRCSSLTNILAGTSETSASDVSLTSHFSFVLGDLNFRTELEGSTDMPEEDHKTLVREIVAKSDWHALNKSDELRRALRQKDCLVGFQTLFCNFPPTFKLERKLGYSYNEKRRPSYTDRVLWKAGHELERCVRPLTYEPIDTFTSSDHKPVRAAFAVDLNAPTHLRPRLTRRNSVMNFATQRKLSRSVPAVQGGKDRLQLFVNNIRCLIDRNEYGSDFPPNPYVCLVSFPEFAMRRNLTRWRKFMNRLFCQSLDRAVSADGSIARYASGWPRTSRRMGTFDADWEEDNIACQVHTHMRDGSAIDLAGAMLRVTVMDYRSTGEDSVLGTFSFNLANLLRVSIEKREKIIREINVKPPARAVPGPVSERVTFEQQDGQDTRLVRRRSVLGFPFFRKKSFDSSCESDDDDPIKGIKIDEPLMKNGRETGRIQCEVETWWMNEATAKIVGTASSNAGASELRKARSGRRPLRSSFSKHHRDDLGARPTLVQPQQRRTNISMRNLNSA
jgi:hypothetical protein